MASGGIGAARLLMELGRYEEALSACDELLDAGAGDLAAVHSDRLKIARYLDDWKRHEEFEDSLRSYAETSSTRPSTIPAVLAVERGRRALAREDFETARVILQSAAAEFAESPRGSEAHFYAGVACWMSGDRDWAKFHFMWVVENLPDDRLYMRARIAAAAEAMPYKNPELGGFRADVGSIGTRQIVEGVQAAREVYERLAPIFADGEFREAPDDVVGHVASASPTLLVAELRDGNEYRVANNRVVDQLEAIGARSISPLVSAIRDENYPGRGYAAWALSQVLKASGLDDERALQVLREASQDEDPYVSALARSGLGNLRKARSG